MRLLEDGLLTPTLLRRFQAEGEFEGGDGRHYAVMLRDDRSLLVHHPFSPSIAPEQIIWAGDVLRLLNRELHHDGAWVVVFTNPKPMQEACILADAGHAEYGRYALIWVDADGDPQFTMEWHEGDNAELRDFADVMLAGLHSTAQKAEAAWQEWHLYMRVVLDPKEGQLIRRARGELPSAAPH